MFSRLSTISQIEIQILFNHVAYRDSLIELVLLDRVIYSPDWLPRKNSQNYTTYSNKTPAFTFSSGDLGTVDFIAIGISLGLTAFIVLVIGYYLWKAQHRTAMGAKNEIGQVSLSALIFNNILNPIHKSEY